MISSGWGKIAYKLFRWIQSGQVSKQRHAQLFLAIVVLPAIASVAYADWLAQKISLGYLYILPLALSALIHRLRTSLFLAVVCVFLHDWFGPYEHIGAETIFRNLLTLIGFIFLVLIVNQLGRQRERMVETIRAQRDQMAQDLELAAEVQHFLLPRSDPRLAGFEIAGRMWPARLIGGDFFDYIEFTDTSPGFVIGDVAGKGTSAALLTASIIVAARQVAREVGATDELMKRLNKVIHEVTDEARFVTMFCGRLRQGGPTLEYTNAGHNPPLLFRFSSGEVETLDHGGLVAGVSPETTYESASVELLPGDVLVMFTDGIVEAENRLEEPYTVEHLKAAISESRHQSAADLLETIMASVVRFSGTEEIHDDCTLVVLKALADNPPGKKMP